jgi:hypothetical protein
MANTEIATKGPWFGPGANDKFSVAASSGDLEKLQEMVTELGTPPMTTLGQALGLASSKGKINCMEWLLEQGAEIDFNLGRPLAWAAAGGQNKAIEWLLERGAAMTEDALNGACSQGRTETVRLLLERGADPNPDNGGPLEFAVSEKRAEIVGILLQAGAKLRSAEVINHCLRKSLPTILKVFAEHDQDPATKEKIGDFADEDTTHSVMHAWHWSWASEMASHRREYQECFEIALKWLPLRVLNQPLLLNGGTRPLITAERARRLQKRLKPEKSGIEI